MRRPVMPVSLKVAEASDQNIRGCRICGAQHPRPNERIYAGALLALAQAAGATFRCPTSEFVHYACMQALRRWCLVKGIPVD